MKRRFTEDSWRKEPWFLSLCAAMNSCKNEEEIANLFRDIATLSELQAMGERLEVAKLLSQGLSYRQVAAKTGASTTTVTRVANFLENGEGGYRKVLNTHRHHRMKVGMKRIDTAEKPDSDPTPSEQKKDVLPIKKTALQKYLGS
ncbi:trp operon repressor [Candidatus Peribacteria bacterium]|nr:MAG: trp operon repressor [Candidatus Peribacteria bacterium]